MANKFIGDYMYRCFFVCLFLVGCDKIPSCSDSSMTELVMDVASDDNSDYKKYIEITGIEESSFDEKVKTKLCVATITPTQYTKDLIESNSTLDFSSPYNVFSFAGSVELSRVGYMSLTYKVYYDELHETFAMKPLSVDADRLRTYVSQVSALENLSKNVNQ